MSTELNILALYGILIIVMILVEVLLAIPQLGLSYLASPRDEKRDATGIAGRANRAVTNCAIGMALFAPAILILYAKGAFTPTTLMAAQIFLIARLIYVVVYLTGIPWARTLAFVTGLLMTLWLYVMAL